jgi:hypothetical protein
MSKNGGFLDVRWDDLISHRGLSLRPHPKQMVLDGVSVAGQDGGLHMKAVVADHVCSCWKCHPEEIPETVEEAVSIRRHLIPRFWKATLDGQPCGFVKEAKPGTDGYVWLARTPPHGCSCKSGYGCTVVLKGSVTVVPDGEE